MGEAYAGRWEGSVFGGTIDHAALGAVVDAQWVLGELPDVITVATLTGMIEYVTASSRLVLGLAPEDMVGRQVCEFLEPEDQHNCVTLVAQIGLGHELELVHRAVRADNTLVSLETRIRLLPALEGVARLVTVSRDVSARSDIEQQATDRARTWAEAVELLHEGVVVLDDEGTVVAANGSAAVLLRLELSQLRRADVRQVLTASDAATGEPVPLSSGLAALTRSKELSVVCLAAPTTPPLRGRMRSVSLPGSSHPVVRVLLVLEAAPAAARPPAMPAHRNDVLSPREICVLRLLAEGEDVRAIANELGLSVHTVRTYVKSILKKMDVRTQLQAVVASARAGVLDLS